MLKLSGFIFLWTPCRRVNKLTHAGQLYTAAARALTRTWQYNAAAT